MLELWIFDCKSCSQNKFSYVYFYFNYIYYIMCFHGAMKHENDVSNAVDCLQVVRIYSFMKKIKVYIRASYIVFLFVKTENNNFIAWWKPRQSLKELSSRWKPSTTSHVFTDLHSNSPKHSPRFSPGYEGKENKNIMFKTVTSTARLNIQSADFSG